ncbi:MAG: pirin family protein [Sulfurimonadaceae bacterium]
MLEKISKEKMYLSNQGWLQSRFHFSFAQYRDLNNLNFGVLRVLNDDIVHPHSGFDMHPHSDMEIISYVVDGEITHKDSMGNEETLKRGDVQYMSAGTGVMHSEYNHGNTDLRLLQIWILPPLKGVNPLYGSYKYEWDERVNKLLPIVSSLSGKAKVNIHQDVNIYVSQLDAQKELTFEIEANRQVYFVQIEGRCHVNAIELNEADALKVVNETQLHIKALTKAHFIMIEMSAN